MHVLICQLRFDDLELFCSGSYICGATYYISIQEKTAVCLVFF